MTLEIKNGTYIIPEGFTAKIDGRKIVVEKKESEEEKIREEIITYLRSCHEPYMKEWISYLEKQKEQKPAEWNKEDKDIINEVASILINDENRADNKVEEDRLAYLAEKIQSLRSQPHWKPSEEQMEMLDNVQRELCGTEYNEGLCSLIDDLEKL